MPLDCMLPFKQLGVCRNQRSTFDYRSCHNKAICRVFVRQVEAYRKHGDFAINGNFNNARPQQDVPHLARVGGKFYAVLE